jgi:trigger factor
MKKRLVAVALCVCTVFSMAACGKKEDTKTVSSEGKLTMGEYKGYTVGESVTVVSDEDVSEYIDSILQTFATTDDVTEGTTAEGDTVKVTYTEAVNGGEAGEGTTTSVTLTSDGFTVSGFTDALIGQAVGSTVEMDLTYPEDYEDTTVAGQPVHYSATINSISVTNTPEYTDDFVSTNYSFAGYTTVDDFTNFIKEEIYFIQVNNTIWDDVIAAQTVESYPTDELKQYVDKAYSQIESMMTSYGYTMDTYYQMVDKTEDELMKELETSCKDVVKEKMFVRAVAEKEGITYSDEAAAKYAAISGFTSVDEFSEYLEYYGEDLQYTVLSYLVQNFVCENAKIVSDEETTAEETTVAAEEDTTTETTEETTAEETTVEETTAE